MDEARTGLYVLRAFPVGWDNIIKALTNKGGYLHWKSCYTSKTLLVLLLHIMENHVTWGVSFEEFIDGFINALVQA